MIIVASSNGKVGIAAAMEVLRNGGSAVDAVEAGTRLVESNPQDDTVGIGGIPNLLGQVELDASIMDGRTLAAGAVAALQGYEHPISIARKVMEELPHVLLAGSGAERFAAEMGFQRRELLTEKARETWEKRLHKAIPEAVLANLEEESALHQWVKRVRESRRAGGTVNFLAQDANGNICAGVSTSGQGWKYPGRVGDSPLIGAGNYADNRYGAAACTGLGEMAILAGTAHSVVLYLKMGLSLEKAGGQAMEDLQDLAAPYQGPMNIVALDKEGRHAGFTNRKERTYVYMTGEMDEPEELPRVLVSGDTTADLE
ncbi:MAG: N(4)-(beta-N-acetylglucosaminyl)-L-asparaginase [Anaerolineales bacterium]|nr:N(4)-(beta-N-acetylglucosaminyl)-L-asparaginase [Anaerolineales bacterium]